MSPFGVSTPSPTFVTANMTMSGSSGGAIAHLARITALGSRTAAGAMSATLSLIFSAKEA
jgi:hypothetical protein